MKIAAMTAAVAHSRFERRIGSARSLKAQTLDDPRPRAQKRAEQQNTNNLQGEHHPGDRRSPKTPRQPGLVHSVCLLGQPSEILRAVGTVISEGHSWLDGTSRSAQHAAVRVLTHVTKLDDCFGQFLVRVMCPCGVSRHIEPEALARLVGWKATLASLAARMRCSSCGKKVAEVVAVARPRPRGVPKNPH